MTHYYNTYYPIPEDLRDKAIGMLTTDKQLLEYIKNIPDEYCDVHGKLSMEISWYGIRFQCLECKEPDKEEKLKQLNKNESKTEKRN